MKADSPVVDRLEPSPNHGERAPGSTPEILLLHYTGIPDGASAAKRMCDPASGVASHYLVEEDGQVVQLVAETRRAWHAGEGAWLGRRDVNSRSIGIEIANPGHAHGYRAFPDAQIEAVIALCRDCLARHPIRPPEVLAHSDIAPERKEDPGELFPWDRLAAAGVGLVLPAVPIRGGRFLSGGDRGEPVAAFQGLLGSLGYEIEVDGVFGERTRLVTTAFQRHHRRDRIDGVADASTVETLHALAVRALELRTNTAT